MSSHVASMGIDSFRNFVDEVYNIDEGQVFRKRSALNQAFHYGYGSIEFAPMSIWAGINAITQVETSTRGTTAAKGRSSVCTWHIWCWCTNQQESFCCS